MADMPFSALTFAPHAPFLPTRSVLQSSNRNALVTSRPRRCPRTPPRAAAEKPPDRYEDSDAHDIPQSAVDWNAEWHTFKQSGMKSGAPQGRQPLTSQQRAQRNMQKKLKNVKDTLPTRQQLFADWRFWVAVILALSLFSAFVQSTTSSPSSYI